MSEFIVTGTLKSGAQSSIKVDAPDRIEAAKQAQARGMVVSNVSLAATKRKLDLNLELGGPKKAQPQEIAVFCRQLAISVQAGLPLREALQGIAEEMERSNLQIALNKIITDLNNGKQFARSLENHNSKGLFSPVFIGLIRVAEETGTLSETLIDLADYLEKGVKLKREISQKLSYPIFMVVAFIGVNIAATFKLFPMFRENFASLGANLPELTLFVFDLNEKMIDASPYIAGVLVAVVVAFILYYKQPLGRMTVDKALLKLGPIGDMIFKISTARFCRTLAITAKGGVGLTEGIEISAAVVTNKYLNKALVSAQKSIMNGQSFTNSLRLTDAFTGLVLRMVGVGEESGQLPTVLDKVSEIYSNEVDTAIAKAVGLLEPIIIILFAGFVTVMVLALYMPVFDMGGAA